MSRLFSMLRSFFLWNPRAAWHLRDGLRWFAGLRLAPVVNPQRSRGRNAREQREAQQRRRVAQRRVAIWLVVCAWLLALGATWATAEEPLVKPGADKPKPTWTEADERFFEEMIRPLLANRCYSCHGPDEQESDLRLDSRAALLKGGSSGPAAIAGNAEKSLLLQVVSYDGDIKMPPAAKLPDAELAALRDWVRRGLPWPEGAELKPADSMEAARQNHWAYQALNPRLSPEAAQRLQAGQPSPGGFDWQAWIQTPVDRYVAASLDAAGLTPSPRADRRTLLRRLSFDLIGLPATPEELDAFQRDPAPDAIAFATQVDRLLASPHYGVRWGRHWLDVARYADTRGYTLQGQPQFPYSYTYRDYVVDALNADLPYDQFVREQLAADFYPRPDGDNRSLAAMGFMTIGRRFLNGHDVIDDRIDVVTRGLLGLTVACARCHDHKYDPIPTADYYALYGVFASCEEPEEPPLIGTPDDTPAYREFLRELEKRQAAHDDFVEQTYQKLLAEFRTKAGEYFLAAVAPDMMDEHQGAVSVAPGDLRPMLVAQWRSFAQGPARKHPWFAAWTQLAGVADDQFAKKLGDFLASPPGDTPQSLLKRLREKQPASRGELALFYSQLLHEAAAASKPQGDANQGKQAQEATADSAKAASAEAENAEAKVENNAEAQSAAGAAKPPGEDGELVSLAQWLRQPEAPCSVTREEARRLFDRVARNKAAQLKKAIDSHNVTSPAAPARAMVLVDKGQPVQARIFVRGNPGRRGDEVPRRFLTVLAEDGTPRPFEQGSGRAELAAAITSPDNPLFARVIVNRVWMHHFGEGLVRTPSDFGSRSDPPSHPRLLDYLAQRLITSGWSLKTLHREILLSAAWQQRSDVRPECRMIDPENRLLWKANRRRLEYEPLRDAMLAVSGRLDERIGGRPVELFKAPYTKRRTVYGLINRQELPSVFRVFDLASPDASTPNRPETTVAQQALYLMNAPFVMEQAQALAAESARRAESLLRVAAGETAVQGTPNAGLPNTVAAAGTSDVTLLRLVELYRLALGREPEVDEQAIALRYLSGGLSGKIGAWEKLAHALLCSNEFVFVD